MQRLISLALSQEQLLHFPDYRTGQCNNSWNCSYNDCEKISDQVIDSVLEPLQQIEVVAGELVNGNLHSNLEYHSDDEVGKLAHDLRKSIRTLGTYIDDIDQTMRQFADGNFSFKPQVEWKGDFVGIKESIVAFEESMSDTVSGIQRAAMRFQMVLSR